MKLENINVEAQIAIIRPIFPKAPAMDDVAVDAQGGATVVVIVKDAEQAEELQALSNVDVDAQGSVTVLTIFDAEDSEALNTLENVAL